MNLRRIVNGVRKVAAGLHPFNESVWPGVRNDVFVAHESIYDFAASLAKDRAVLDAGCGTGYGSAILGRTARSVLGVDIDSSRHFMALSRQPIEASFIARIVSFVPAIL